MGHLQSKKLARQKNAAMTLGHSGVHGTLAVIADPVHTKNENLDKSLFKLCVQLKENQFKPNITPSIVQSLDHGEPVSYGVTSILVTDVGDKMC